jgi:hypothetical protein
MEQRSLAFISDDELLRRLADVLFQSRRVEADLIEHIAEVDARRLFLREGSASMFAYCTDVLRLSEAEAYARITVARASRRHAALLPRLREGRVHLSGIVLLAPYLTLENADELLGRAEHKTKRQIEGLVAEIAPRPDAPSFVRRLPERSDAQGQNAQRAIAGRADVSGGGSGCGDGASIRADHQGHPEPMRGADVSNGAKEEEALLETAQPAASLADLMSRASLESPLPATTYRPVTAARPIEALAPGRYKVQFTASQEFREKLERLSSLLMPQLPGCDLATVIERAVTEAIERIEARRFGKTMSARAAPVPELAGRTRHIPAVVRRHVAERNGLQCGFVGRNGRRCSERADLEYHHRHPWALGGGHDSANIGLLCRRHNAWLAEQDFGQSAIGRSQESRGVARSRST